MVIFTFSIFIFKYEKMKKFFRIIKAAHALWLMLPVVT